MSQNLLINEPISKADLNETDEQSGMTRSKIDSLRPNQKDVTNRNSLVGLKKKPVKRSVGLKM